MKIILSEKQISITIMRLAHQIIENHEGLENLALIGVQPRGLYLADRIVKIIAAEFPDKKICYGKLDITFYRDDIRQEVRVANKMDIPFSIADKNIVLIDDVLFTGRTTRAAMDAVFDLGRPKKIELCVLIDRRWSREIPIHPDYIGKQIDSTTTQKVKMHWAEKDGKDELYFV